MSTKTRKKLCWNCEGNVSLENETCPYCGVSLDVSPMAGTDPNLNAFASPFKNTKSSSSMIPKAPYNPPKNETKEEPEKQVEEQEQEEPGFALSELHKTLLILVSLSLGTILLIFGAVLFLFSDSRGIFTLHWHGSYWYIYFVVAIPLLYFGWKAMHDFQSNNL